MHLQNKYTQEKPEHGYQFLYSSLYKNRKSTGDIDYVFYLRINPNNLWIFSLE